MSSTPPAGPTAMPDLKQLLVEEYEREHGTTMRVLRSYPPDRLDLRPHGKCKTARELAWVFVEERSFANMVLTGGEGEFQVPERPDSWDDQIQAVEDVFQGFQEKLRGMSQEYLLASVPFLAGKDQPIQIQRFRFLWMLLFDEIHHRGQFSTYLRMADGRVPSIYGPTADEPWE